MTRFREVFSHRHVVLPVIHVESLAQALRNTTIARDAGADGVFVINHGMSDAELLTIHAQVVAEHPGWWVGVNCLGFSAEKVCSTVSPDVAGIWVDNAGIDESTPNQPKAQAILDIRRSRGWPGLYFGGVAFKYQRQVDDLVSACQLASGFMDVITTSGPGTGHAASTEKIQRMKDALGAMPLAIASGITPANVGEYLGCADCFLVATGISHSFTELDPLKVAALIERVRAAG